MAPIKTCDYCQSVGDAFTFMSGETICAACLKSVPTDSREMRHMIFDLRANLDAANKEIDRLQEEPSELFYQLHAENGRLKEVLSEVVNDHETFGNGGVSDYTIEAARAAIATSSKDLK